MTDHAKVLREMAKRGAARIALEAGAEAIEECERLRAVLREYSNAVAECMDASDTHYASSKDVRQIAARRDELRAENARLRELGRKLQLRAWCPRHGEPSPVRLLGDKTCSCDVCTATRAWDEECK